MYIEKIKNAKNIVRRILTDIPETRDNDRLLMVEVWKMESPSLMAFGYASDFTDNLIKGRFSCPKSIARARALIQAKEVELRGETYGYRHKVEEPEVRQNINN